jgi:peptidyl-dipeptidase Dcp
VVLAEARATVQARADDPKPPTFGNTVTALELADRRLNLISEAFRLVANANSNSTREALGANPARMVPGLVQSLGNVARNAALVSKIAPFDRITTYASRRNGFPLSL